MSIKMSSTGLALIAIVIFGACAKMPEPDREGILQLRQTHTADIDLGRTGTKRGRDIWFRAINDTEKYLEPQEDSTLTLVGPIRHWLFGCPFDSLKSDRIPINKLNGKKVICVETNMGHQAELTVINVKEKELNFRYRIWGKNLPEQKEFEYEGGKTMESFEPDRMKFIQENLNQLAHKQFPDNTHNTWKLWSTVHNGEFTFVQVIPDPKDVGYEKFKFMIHFPEEGKPEIVAVYAFENNEYTLLSYIPGWKDKIPEKPY